MSTVGTKITISMIDDGSQIHASLISDKPLSQAFAGDTQGAGICYPDWSPSHASNQPTVYLDIKNGVTPINSFRNNTLNWYYNGILLTFDSTTHKSTNIGLVDVFMETEYNAGTTLAPRMCRALKIIDNLATFQNVDEDTIRVEGEVGINSAYLPFASSIAVSITSLAQNDYNCTIKSVKSDWPGYLNNRNGFVFDEYESDIVLISDLVQLTPEETVAPIAFTAFNTRWYINGVEQTAVYHGSTPYPTGNPAQKCIVWLGTTGSGAGHVQWIGDTCSIPNTIGYNALLINKEAITDYSNIQCDCYSTDAYSPRKLATNYREIDDQTDEERTCTAAQVTDTTDPAAYVEPFNAQISESGEGCDNTIRLGQQVNYKVFEATELDVTDIKTSYKHWYIHIIKANLDTYGAVSSEQTGGEKAPVDATLTQPMLSGNTIRKFWWKMTRDTTNGYGKMFMTSNDLINFGRTMTGWIYGSTDPFETMK